MEQGSRCYLGTPTVKPLMESAIRGLRVTLPPVQCVHHSELSNAHRNGGQEGGEGRVEEGREIGRGVESRPETGPPEAAGQQRAAPRRQEEPRFLDKYSRFLDNILHKIPYKFL